MRGKRGLVIVAATAGALVLPAIAIGQGLIHHGGSPSDVFSNTEGQEACTPDPVRRGAAALSPTPITVETDSHVVAYFTASMSQKPATGTEAILKLRITGTDFTKTSRAFLQRQDAGHGHNTVTIMWTFADIAPGDYSVLAIAKVPALPADENGVNLQACTLTAFVNPVAG